MHKATYAVKGETCTYTQDELEAHWKQFKKRQIYRCLVGGKWVMETDFQRAKAMQPLRIEIKRADEAMSFPAYLAEVAG